MTSDAVLKPHPGPWRTIASHALARALSSGDQKPCQALRPDTGGGVCGSPVVLSTVRNSTPKRAPSMEYFAPWFFRSGTSTVKLNACRIPLPGLEEQDMLPDEISRGLFHDDYRTPVPEHLDPSLPVRRQTVLCIFRDHSVLLLETWRTTEHHALLGARIHPLVLRLSRSIRMDRSGGLKITLATQTHGNIDSSLALRLGPFFFASDVPLSRTLSNAQYNTSSSLEAGLFLEEAITPSVQGFIRQARGIPTPFQKLDRLDVWPDFLPFRTWTRKDAPLISGRLSQIAQVLSGEISPSSRIMLTAGTKSSPAFVQCTGAGTDGTGKKADDLFFQGEWKRELFAGWSREWIGNSTSSGRSNTYGHFRPHRAMISSGPLSSGLSAHETIRIRSSLAGQPCPVSPLTCSLPDFPKEI